MKLSETLRERGYAYQHSSETLEEITDSKKRTLYLGVDPTADSMHVGQLQGILVLRRFLEDGHKVIVIVGGGTGMVGDPGGKSAERNLMDDATIDKNAAALKKQFTQLFGNQSFEMVNNADWLRKLNLMEFLRDVGKHFTVNEMVKRDSVRPRLETPEASISYTEFSYMLLQAYDYYYLHERYGCDLQVGGSDQWGNIVSGVELIRRKSGGISYALSWPLLTTPDGKKFGKTEGNAVWLDAEKTTPYKFYQFWLNTDDAQVGEMLLKMTLLPVDLIEQIMQTHQMEPSSRIAQKKLAEEVTKLAHGNEQAEKAIDESAALFGGGSIESIQGIPVAFGLQSSIVSALVDTGLASSKREARQFIVDGAIQLNEQRVTDDRPLMEDTDLNNGKAVLKRGKRFIVVIEPKKDI